MSEVCDQAEYEGSPMFDEYFDRVRFLKWQIRYTKRPVIWKICIVWFWKKMKGWTRAATASVAGEQTAGLKT